MLVDAGEASGAGVISVGTLQQLLYGAAAAQIRYRFACAA